MQRFIILFIISKTKSEIFLLFSNEIEIIRKQIGMANKVFKDGTTCCFFLNVQNIVLLLSFRFERRSVQLSSETTY